MQTVMLFVSLISQKILLNGNISIPLGTSQALYSEANVRNVWKAGSLHEISGTGSSLK